MTQTINTQLVNTQTAARILGLAPITLRLMARAGTAPIPFYKYSPRGHYRWSLADIYAFLEQQPCPPTATTS